MPPSGFSKKAINGLLKFVKASYEASLSDFKGNEEEFLKRSSEQMQVDVKEVTQKFPLKISEEGVIGLVEFVTTCYDDLVKEIQQGHDSKARVVINGKAMEKEIQQIGEYLEAFSI